ncbi:MAG: hypothetical protein ACYC91_14620 [Solirubrobacteraceae bacterium]
MSHRHHPTSRILGALAMLTGGLAVGTGAANAATTPAVSTDRTCYLVGQTVTVMGSGFADSREFDVSIDGVDFGQSTTSSTGTFSTQLVPGGLPAGAAQGIDRLVATDGSSTAGTAFTVTRSTGGRFLASRGRPHILQAPFEVWGFARDGVPRPVYVHYVSPSGRNRATVFLGRTGGQCGYLRTGSVRFFPFIPSVGRWTLQLDTSRAYRLRVRGPLARLRVRIARG